MMSGRIRRDEKGQVMMFGLFIFLVMLLFLGLIFNTGIVIIQKMQMQNAADAAALTGAIVQARGLSWMAAENEAIAKIYRDANVDCLFAHGVFDSRKEGKEYILENFPPEIEVHLNNLSYINKSYPARAKNLAEQVARANVPGPLSFQAIMPGHNAEELTRYNIERHNIHFLYWWGILPMLSSQRVDTFVRKDPNTITYFVVKLTGLGAHPDQLMSGGFFGSIPPITTYAAAKPYGGWLLSPIQAGGAISLPGIGEIDFVYPIWVQFTLPVVGEVINMKKHHAYLVRIGDRRLQPRPTAVPQYNLFQH